MYIHDTHTHILYLSRTGRAMYIYMYATNQQAHLHARKPLCQYEKE
jgi:hypothetical protein